MSISTWEKQLGGTEIPPRCLKRIQMDISKLIKNPLEGIYALSDEANIRILRLLIVGPPDTAYHGGMFTFLIGFTNDYPMKPPSVRCLTTSEVAFHPHISGDGSICLSIIEATFGGSAWTPVFTSSTLAITLQSFLSDKPYHHVNGYNEKDEESVKFYKFAVQYQIIKAAVINVMENIDKWDEYFVEKIKAIFNLNYERYINFCKENMHHNGKKCSGPFGSFKCECKSFLERLELIKKNLVTK